MLEEAFGSIGMGMFGMVKGAVKSEMKHILKGSIKKEESSTARSLRALTEKENPIPPAIWDLQKDFNRPSFKPIDWLHTLENLNKHLNLRELVGNFRWIEEFTKTIEKLSTYITENRSKIWPKLSEDMFQEIKNLRDNISKILERWEFSPIEIQPLKVALKKDVDKALVSLKPELFQPIK